jgi:hypothetical protein
VGRLEGMIHLEDLGLDGKIILKWSSRSGIGRHGLIDLVQDRDRWQGPINTVINFRFPQNNGHLFTR